MYSATAHPAGGHRCDLLRSGGKSREHADQLCPRLDVRVEVRGRCPRGAKFDLRAIAGEAALFDNLQAEVLAQAKKNSIFVAHMISNALKHTVPLGLLRGFALIRSGEHKNTIDLKHSGVVPEANAVRSASSLLLRACIRLERSWR